MFERPHSKEKVAQRVYSIARKIKLQLLPFHGKARVVASASRAVANSLKDRIGSMSNVKEWEIVPVDSWWHGKVQSLGCKPVSWCLKGYCRDTKCQSQQGGESASQTVSCQPDLCARIHILNCPQKCLLAIKNNSRPLVPVSARIDR